MEEVGKIEQLDHEPERAVVVKENINTAITPVMDARAFKENWQKWEELKQAVLDKSDIQSIQGRDFKKKSFWRKLGTAFNIRLEEREHTEKNMKALISTISKDTQYGPKEVKEVELYPMDWEPSEPLGKHQELKIDTVFSYIVRATATNGVYQDGDGHCSIYEKGHSNTYHNAKSTAFTRAKNRAISDLVGGGEVSAEEANGGYSKGYDNKTQSTKEFDGKIYWGKHKDSTVYDVPFTYLNWVMENFNEQKVKDYIQKNILDLMGDKIYSLTTVEKLMTFNQIQAKADDANCTPDGKKQEVI